MPFNYITLAGLLVGYLLPLFAFRPKKKIRSGSIQVAYDIQPSTKACYDRLREILKSRDIPMNIKEVSKSEGNLSTGKRLYLQIKKGRFTYWLCAAPYGNTFFFSYWLKLSYGFLTKLVRWIPFIGPPIFYFITKLSFYQADSYAVFQHVVTDALNQTAKEITESQGARVFAPENQAILKTFPEEVPSK